jgi:hypothetical protein
MVRRTGFHLLGTDDQHRELGRFEDTLGDTAHLKAPLRHRSVFAIFCSDWRESTVLSFRSDNHTMKTRISHVPGVNTLLLGTRTFERVCSDLLASHKDIIRNGSEIGAMLSVFDCDIFVLLL